MAGRRIHLLLVQGQQAFKAAEVAAVCDKSLLMQIIAENIQYHILPGDYKRLLSLPDGMKQITADFHAADRLDTLFMTGARNIGIHIVLGKTDLAANLVGVDFAPADQLIDRGFAHMENLRDLLSGK